MTKKLTMFMIAALLLFVSQAAFADQCGALGDAPGCNLLITINANGSVSITTGTGGTNWYDGVEDTLVGVQNNWNQSLTSINLTGADIFGFDGDGAFGPSCITTPIGTPAPCGTGGTAAFQFYNGPGNHFIVANVNNGTVVFENGVAGCSGTGCTGGHSAFSLEGNPGVTGLTGGGLNQNVPEPGTIAMFGTGLLGLAGSLRRKLKV
jgi:hypothetical protein